LEAVMWDIEPELYVVIGIDNHDQIAAAYGMTAIHDIHEGIHRSLIGLPGVRCIIAANDTQYIHIEVRDLDLLNGLPDAPMTFDEIVELLLYSIGSMLLPFGDTTLVVAPSLIYASGRSEQVPPLANIREMHDPQGLTPRPVTVSETCCQGYRDDMARAVDVFEALTDDRLQLAWQPVRHSPYGIEVLYYECLVRLMDPDGQMRMPGEFIPALERLGVMRPFDPYVVRRVMDELEAAPDISLAVNISAQSAIDDAWWHTVKEDLARAPDVARRLVLEITESAELASMYSATAFIASMCKLGCKIAIDDFGKGHASLHHLVALKPDMVKVDAFYVRWAEQTPQGQAGIAHLVGLLATLAPIVIVEGIETDDQSTMIRSAGGYWQQGYHHGGPTLVRPSKYGKAIALLSNSSRRLKEADATL
jgi:EAL domain-containing protein (putative c-di-GMP-specific phosphodiesterase class I)